MPSTVNTQTLAISGFGPGKALPDGMQDVNTNVSNGLTALAGGGQTSATALSVNINRITTCATAGDSVKLPLSATGLFISVVNSGATYANVFPFLGDIIDGLAANTAISIPAGGMVIFTCAVAGMWNSTPVGFVAAKYTTGTTATTFAAGQLTGAGNVNYANTQATPGSIATRTATQMFTDDPYARVGASYVLRIINAQGTGTLTVTAGSGVTLTGTATVAINTWREFIVTYTTATALVIQNNATGTFS